jgi:AraC-like DNA-binding protein
MDFELVPAAPAPALRGTVIEYRGFRADATAPPAQPEHPSGCVPLIVDLGGGWDVATPASGYRPARMGGFVAGMHDAFALVRAAGPALGVQVDLAPLGARRLLGLPMHELVNRAVPLEDVLGREARALVGRLADAPGWAERFAILDAALTRRIADAPPVSPGVEWAWERLVATAGAVSVGSLGSELGWSRKRLVARFRDEIGLTPKTCARVLRFHSLVVRLRADGAAASWAELAAAAGYFDQSHLVRDVRRFAGVTPTELVARVAPHRAGLPA